MTFFGISASQAGNRDTSLVTIITQLSPPPSPTTTTTDAGHLWLSNGKYSFFLLFLLLTKNYYLQASNVATEWLPSPLSLSCHHHHRERRRPQMQAICFFFPKQVFFFLFLLLTKNYYLHTSDVATKWFPSPLSLSFHHHYCQG